MSGAVLVTGAAGFVGGHLALACRDAGLAVTAVDTRPVPEPVAGFAEVVTARAGSPAVVADVRAGRYRAVLHQGGISSTLAPDDDALRAANVDEPLALAEACAASGTAFAFASSHSVYGTIHGRHPVAEHDVDVPARCTGPLHAYARSKLALEREMRARFGTDSVWAGYRYTNVFGPGEEHKGPMASIVSQMLHGAAAGRRLRVFADTMEACRDYVPVDAVVATLVAGGLRPPPTGVYNLGSGVPVSFAALLGWCAELRPDGALDVRLVPNPVADRYQYWTCADQTAAAAVLPSARARTLDEVRAAACRLYASFRDALTTGGGPC